MKEKEKLYVDEIFYKNKKELKKLLKFVGMSVIVVPTPIYRQGLRAFYIKGKKPMMCVEYWDKDVREDWSITNI